MSVSKTPQGTFRARVRDITGVQRTKTFKRKADAQAWERKQLAARDVGEMMPSQKVTVAEFADVWLTSARNLAPGSIDTYNKSLSYILPALGKVQLSKLTPELIDAFMDKELADGLARSTVNRHYRTIHRLCVVAMERRRLQVNPCTFVHPPKPDGPPMRFMTADQVEALADAINPRFRAWVLVACWGGLRWGELEALQPHHFDGNAITVIEQINNTALKTKGSRRRVVLPPSVAADLTAHIANYPGTYIFTNTAGRPLNHASFTGNHFKKALVKAGIDRDTRIHDCRHTCAALLIAGGAHPKMVAEYLGHSGIGVTMNRYGHIFPVMHEQVAADLDRMRPAPTGQDDDRQG
jgi:integrase